MSYDEMFVDVYCAREFQEQIIALAREHDIEMTDFARISPTNSVSPFPLLDPVVVEAIKQATLIVILSTKGVQFIASLTDLIDKSKGKAKAVDRDTQKAPAVKEK